MDIADLKVFDAVARLGGMNRAAVELNTVQSNITARIKALEADIGCLLFERRPRGVALTAAGRRLLPYAARATRLIADARCAARDDGSPRGILTIGSLETTAALRLTPLLAGYAANYPNVDLVLRHRHDPGTRRGHARAERRWGLCLRAGGPARPQGRGCVPRGT
jgi:DNA-binding transcriptional LysR family regulator